MAGEHEVDAAARQALVQELEAYFGVRGEALRDASRGDQALRVATAALLVQIGRADLETRHDEHRAVARALEHVLQATPEEAAAIVRAAEEQIEAQRPIHAFTGAIDRCFTREEKRRLVEGLWKVAVADAELQAHEEYLVRKIAELIHLPWEDFLRAKLGAKEAFFRGDDGA
jgi:uncharacterized tellurite resistance protein B-like protein